MTDLTVTITNEQCNAIADRLTERLWRYNHRSRVDGENELVIAPTVQLTTELVEFVLNEAIALHREWVKDD